MIRRTLLILLLALNAVTPALAATCALECALAEGMPSAAEDCHGIGASDKDAPFVPDSGASDDMGGSASDASLMQAACAYAATTVATPSLVDVATTTVNDRIPASIRSSLSRPFPPPDHPPRA